MSSDALDPERVITLPQRPVMHLAVVTLVFALLGPLIGALLGAILLSMFAVAGSDTGLVDALSGTFSDAFDAGVLRLYLAPYWAFVPAAVLGAFFGWHQGWRGPVPSVGGVLAGAGIGAVYFLISEFFGLGIGLYGASFSIVVSGLVALLMLPILRLLASRNGMSTASTERDA